MSRKNSVVVHGLNRNLSLSEDIQDNSLIYDAVPFSIDDHDEDYDTAPGHDERTMSNSRRWSILEKLERRYSNSILLCHQYTCISVRTCTTTATVDTKFFCVIVLSVFNEQ